MKACFTGHRPNKLGGYKIPNPIYNRVRSYLDQAIDRALQRGVDTFISGGALGVDQWALDLLYTKRPAVGRIIVAKPFPEQACKWPLRCIKSYDSLIQQADAVIEVSDGPYDPSKMQKRNIWMVDRSDIIIAVWDGSSGGTANCVNYAKSKNKEIWWINLAKIF